MSFSQRNDRTCPLTAGSEGFDAVLARLLALLDEFSEAPFTAQRLCELLLHPRKIYSTSTRKLMNALEKLLTVSSTMPVMVMAPAKEGSYQEATENELVSSAGSPRRRTPPSPSPATNAPFLDPILDAFLNTHTHPILPPHPLPF